MSPQPKSKASNLAIAGVLVAFIAAGGLFPLWYTRHGARVRINVFLQFRSLWFPVLPKPNPVTPYPVLHEQVDSGKALPRQAAIRGNYNNAGSRDAGPDASHRS